MARKKRIYSKRYERNLLAAYNRADKHDRLEGLTWYRQANHEAHKLAEKYSVSLESTAGVISALSPGRNWEKNLADADIFFREFAAGYRGKQLPRIGSYGWRNIAKAEKIALGANPLDVLGGNKVRAFYQCIIDPTRNDVVCIDRHAKSAAKGVKLADHDTSVGPAEYAFIARHYKRCAEITGLLPHQFQAIVWVVWRRLSGNLQQQDLAYEVPF